MASPKKSPRGVDAARVLVIDIGGTNVKVRLGAHGAVRKIPSGTTMTAKRMVREIQGVLGGKRFDAVSIGYPGLVHRGRIAREPHNLAPGWVGFDFARAFGAPVRIVNDAAMQAIGSYAGGRMLFLGLGTGLGATLIIDGLVESTEIAHLPFRRDRTFEEYVGERARRRRGNRRWMKSVYRMVDALRAAFDVDYVVLGGGNAERLESLPAGVRRGSNRHAFTGGLRMWRDERFALPGAADRRTIRAGG